MEKDFENCRLDKFAVKVDSRNGSRHPLKERKNTTRNNSNVSSISPEIQVHNLIKPNPSDYHKTRNSKMQQHSHTENEICKIESLGWIADQKNYTNDLQNYLTEFKEMQTLSSEMSSQAIKSPPSQRNFQQENYQLNNILLNRMQSQNFGDVERPSVDWDSKCLPHQVYNSWKTKNNLPLGNLHHRSLFDLDCNKQNTEITLSPADVNKLFNAMELNSFDKRTLFPPKESARNGRCVCINPLNSLSK